MNNVEIFPEIFADNISGGVGGLVSDIGEVIELVRRGGGGHGSESEFGRSNGQIVTVTVKMAL